MIATATDPTFWPFVLGGIVLLILSGLFWWAHVKERRDYFVR